MASLSVLPLSPFLYHMALHHLRLPAGVGEAVTDLHPTFTWALWIGLDMVLQHKMEDIRVKYQCHLSSVGSDSEIDAGHSIYT